jgi:hypothetical protein
MKTCPNGEVGGGGVAMFMLKPVDAVPPALSVTWMVKGKDPTTVGIPEMIPVEEDNERLVGSCPFKTDQV